MIRPATLSLVLTSLGALALGCSDPDGLRAFGDVNLTVHQSGQPDGSTSFHLPSDTVIDAPPGVGTGFYGTCARTNGRWSIDLTRADGPDVGLRRAVLDVPEGSAATSASATFTLGTTAFAGTARCTGTAVSFGDNGVRLNATCTGIAASGDPRTVDAAVSLTLERCTLR